MHSWKIIMELLGGFSICHLILFANELNGISAGPVHSKMLYNKRDILQAARAKRISKLATTTTTTITTQSNTGLSEAATFELCAATKNHLGTRERIIKHNTLEDYYFLLDEGMRGKFISLIAIASFVSGIKFFSSGY
ncbi:unnamed protein product [Brugia timori]|uniref:Uncharacterized protein n=1 Tax=Brugia timori TaxID=42155 RepID=A0A0R3QM44_9BILA|nr:unnamed protein product [Brugia timori]